MILILDDAADGEKEFAPSAADYSYDDDAAAADAAFALLSETFSLGASATSS